MTVSVSLGGPGGAPGGAHLNSALQGPNGERMNHTPQTILGGPRLPLEADESSGLSGGGAVNLTLIGPTGLGQGGPQYPTHCM